MQSCKPLEVSRPHSHSLSASHWQKCFFFGISHSWRLPRSLLLSVKYYGSSRNVKAESKTPTARHVIAIVARRPRSAVKTQSECSRKLSQPAPIYLPTSVGRRRVYCKYYSYDNPNLNITLRALAIHGSRKVRAHSSGQAMDLANSWLDPWGLTP